MTTGSNGRSTKARPARAATLGLLALAAMWSAAPEARAQWTAPDAQGNTSTTSAGNVGVGTAAPASKLDIQGATGVTVRTAGASAGFSIFDRPSVPGDQIIFQGNTGNYSVINTATRNANFGSEKLSGLAMWTVDNTYTPNATQFQLQNSPSFGGVIFTQKFGTGAQGDKKVSFQTAWNQMTTPTQFVLDTNGNVGVGTAAPAYQLDLLSPTDKPFRVRDTAGREYFSTSSRTGPYAHWTTPVVSLSGGRLIVENNGPEGDNHTVIRRMVNSVYFNPSDHPDLPGAFIVRQKGGNYALYVDQGLSGNVGIGAAPTAAKLNVGGDMNVTGTITGGNISAKYQDVAEWVPSTQKLSAGTVVVLDIAHNNHVTTTETPYDTRVAGVVSAQPGIMLGEAGEGKALIATTGRVKVKVDATRAPIRVGDLLVTGDAPGVAMRSQPLELSGVPIHRPGTLIGKALEPLAKGTGEILVLLSLQ